MIILDLEIILPIRVAEENFIDLLNLMRASFRIKGSDWQRALVSTRTMAGTVTSCFRVHSIKSNLFKFKMYHLQEYAFTPEYFDAEWCKNITLMERYKDFYEIEDLNTYLNGSNAIQDIGSEFVEDVQMILEKFNNNTYVTHIITMDLVSDFSLLKFCA